jgi:hypothetical protein
VDQRRTRRLLLKKSIAGLIREFKDRFASDVTGSSTMNVAARRPFRVLQSLAQPRHRLRCFEVESAEHPESTPSAP